jgi:hypothetical protein
MRMVSRSQRDTLKRRLLIAALIRLAHWKIVRLQQLAGRLQNRAQFHEASCDHAHESRDAGLVRTIVLVGMPRP